MSKEIDNAWCDASNEWDRKGLKVGQFTAFSTGYQKGYAASDGRLKDGKDFVGRSSEKQYAFGSELRSLINRYSLENDSDTPDIVLTTYLLACLKAFNLSVESRENLMKGGEALAAIGETESSVVIVYKDGTNKSVPAKSAWEYENDPDYLVTIGGINENAL